MIDLVQKGLELFSDHIEVEDPADPGVALADQGHRDFERMSVQTAAGVAGREMRQVTGRLDLKVLAKLEFHDISPGMARTTLHLAKENFKFSSAHFLIFDETHAERLHGHNYQVSVDLGVPSREEMAAKGFFVDFNVFKREIKAKVDAWDEHVLLPERQPEMRFRREGSSLHVDFRDRYYVFPADEVILLPVTNTSVEQLSRLLAEDLFQTFRSQNVSWLTVKVEETRGQGASTTIGEGDR